MRTILGATRRIRILHESNTTWIGTYSVTCADTYRLDAVSAAKHVSCAAWSGLACKFFVVRFGNPWLTTLEHQITHNQGVLPCNRGIEGGVVRAPQRQSGWGGVIDLESGGRLYDVSRRDLLKPEIAGFGDEGSRSCIN